MAKSLELKILPEPILHQPARELTQAELQQPDFKQLLLDMEQTMQDHDGIGLAAPQIGRNFRVAIVKTEAGILPLINPRILRKSFKKELLEEGCLSIPQVFGTVKRSIKLKISTLDPSGKRIKFTATGMFARVIQHEIDHINGVLFIDRAKEITGGKEILEKMQSPPKV